MAWTSLSIILVGVLFSVDSVILPLPPYLNACKKGSPDFDGCVTREALNGLPGVLKGDRKYGIPKFNPLKISAVKLETAGNLVINLKDVEIFGLDKTVLKKTKLDPYGQTLSVDFAVDNLVILGKYDMDGKILVLPLKGNGDCNITATDLDFKYKTTYKVTEKNGESHMYLDQQSLDFNSTRFYFQFDNLFNGDPVLGPNTNKVLNDEWESVLMEIKPAIGEAVSAVASSIVNSISERVPYRFIVL